MFRSTLSKSLRDYRIPILAWGCGMALLMAVAFATATPAVLALLASLAPLLSFLGTPIAMQTPAGYVTFRYLGTVLPLILSIWPILVGTRMVRGEEERGTMDVLLATPQPRARLLLEKIVALAIALLGIAVLFALGIVVGEARIGVPVDFVRALLTGLNLSLLAFFFGMVALLLSQFTLNRGSATGWASGLLVLALLLDITGREVHGSWLQYLSPFYYYNLNHPLIASFQGQPLGALLLAVLAVLFAALALVFFARRDIGRPAFVWQSSRASGTQQAQRSLSRAERAISTRTIGLHAFFGEGRSSFWWLLGIVVFSVYILLLTPSLQQPFYHVIQQTPWLANFLYDSPANTNAALLGTIIFTFMPPLLMILGLTLALKWSADLENGRLELTLSTPQARPRVLLERFGANALVIVLAPVLTWLTITIGAQADNLNVDQGRILAASFSMIPPALITIGLVYALAGRLRYGAVLVIAAAYLILSFIEESLEGNIQWPTWVMSLSVLHLYGNPVFTGMDWRSFLGMTAVAIALLVIGLVQFRYADVKLG